MLEHIQAQTYHARRGSLKNAFHYGVDYVLSDLKDDDLLVLSRNRFNLWSIWDSKHGGQRGDGRGLVWFQEELLARGIALEGLQLYLLAQPSFLWFHFNPVSFWIAMRGGKLLAIVAEVNNTFGHRHCYFCAHRNFDPIDKSHTIIAEKMMHVSPFQKVEGQYRFNFDISDTAISIRINYENGEQGVLATLSGDREPASNGSLLKAAFLRPLGAIRVLALIHGQAVILFFKRAPFTRKPSPPEPLITDSHTFRKKQL
jgi:DUF1365 family protein